MLTVLIILIIKNGANKMLKMFKNVFIYYRCGKEARLDTWIDRNLIQCSSQMWIKIRFLNFLNTVFGLQ